MRTSILLAAVVVALSSNGAAAAAAAVAPRQASSDPASAAATATGAVSSAIGSAANSANGATATAASATEVPTAGASSSTAAGGDGDDNDSDASTVAGSATSAASPSSTGNSSVVAPVVSASAPAQASPVPELPPYGAQNLSSYANDSLAGPNGYGNSECRSVTLNITANALNINYTNVDDMYSNQSYITGQVLEFANLQMPWIQSHESGTEPNNRTYSISADYCTPRQGASDNSSLILAVHGIGFSKSYWNFSPDNSSSSEGSPYSFIDQATSQGYSVLAYDRLGTGESEHPDSGFQQVQAATEVSILNGILAQLRNGSAIEGQQFDRIVGVGHSYGSVQLQASSATAPDLLDGIALTGYSNSTAGLTQFFAGSTLMPANQVQPDRFNNISSVYLLTGSAAADLTLFAWPPNYSPEAIEVARSQYSDVVNLGTLTSQATVQQPATNFAKPVFVISGEHDLPFCSGTCQPALLDGVRDTLYPQASNFSSYIVPSTGHGIEVHYTAASANRLVMDFIMGNGL